MKSKGFTLIELLAVIAIIVIILLIAIPIILNVISVAKQATYDNDKLMMERATKNYLANHESELPTTINGTTTISLSTLITDEFITEILDPISNNACDSSASNVLVTKTTATQYSYTVTLICDNFGEEYVDENDNVNPVLSVKQNLNDVGVYGFDDNYMYFDNANDNINIPYNAALAPTVTISFSFWMYSSDWSVLQGDDTLISKTENGGYNLHLDGDRPTNYVGPLVRRNGAYGGTEVLYTSLSSGWHFFMATFDGQYTKFYIDGTLSSNNDALAMYPIGYTYTNSLFLGAEAGTSTSPDGGYYKGIISDARIYDIALNETQVNVIYDDNRQNTDPDLADFSSALKGYWRFNDNSGTTAADSSGNGFTGTVYGTPTWIP